MAYYCSFFQERERQNVRAYTRKPMRTEQKVFSANAYTRLHAVCKKGQIRILLNPILSSIINFSLLFLT